MLTGGVNGCNECTIRNSYIQLGSNAVYADAYEVYLEGMAADMSYGRAVVYLVNTGGHIGRSKFDQAYPAQAHGWTPRHGISTTSWSAGTAYTQNALVVVGSYLLQAMNNGTSGGAQPTVQPYGANITDGSVTWQLVGPIACSPPAPESRSTVLLPEICNGEDPPAAGIALHTIVCEPSVI